MRVKVNNRSKVLLALFQIKLQINLEIMKKKRLYNLNLQKLKEEI